MVEDAGLKPDPVPQEPLPVQNDRWEQIFAVPGGHRYYREKATGKVAIADDSGEWPQECDGGPLFVDTRSPLGPDRAWIFAVPLVGSGIAMAGADEAAGLIRHCGCGSNGRRRSARPSPPARAIRRSSGRPSRPSSGRSRRPAAASGPDGGRSTSQGQEVVEFDGHLPVPAGG